MKVLRDNIVRIAKRELPRAGRMGTSRKRDPQVISETSSRGLLETWTRPRFQRRPARIPDFPREFSSVEHAAFINEVG